MGPDYLFIGAGTAAVLASLWLIGLAVRGRNLRLWLPALLWSLFAAGLLIQGSAQHLRIEGRMFVVNLPTRPSLGVSPKSIVERERLMHLLSAVFTVAGALGLAFCYRGAISRPPGLLQD